MNGKEISIKKQEKQKTEHFVNIIREQKIAMFRLAFSIVMNKEDAEDVVGETVLKAYSHLDNLRQINKMKAWLFQILVNESKNCLKRKNELEYFQDKDYGYEEENTSDLLEYVYQLENHFRTVVLLYYFDGFSVKEIANILGISDGTVKSRLSRARQKLKEYLENI